MKDIRIKQDGFIYYVAGKHKVPIKYIYGNYYYLIGRIKKEYLSDEEEKLVKALEALGGRVVKVEV